MNIVFKRAVTMFLSRVVLRKLSAESIELFRNVEKACKHYMKGKSDIQFLKVIQFV